MESKLFLPELECYSPRNVVSSPCGVRTKPRKNVVLVHFEASKFKNEVKVKAKFSHTRNRALGPELIPVYRQSACR